MKYFIIFVFLIISYISCSSDDLPFDPNTPEEMPSESFESKYSTTSCSSYLCSSFTNAASAYLSSGCVGNFPSYIQNYYHLNTDTNNINLSSNTSNKIISSESTTFLIFVSFLSGLISMFIGYYLGKKNNVDVKYHRVPTV